MLALRLGDEGEAASTASQQRPRRLARIARLAGVVRIAQLAGIAGVVRRMPVPSRPRPDGRRLAAGVIAVAVLVAGVTVASRAWFSTRDATDRTHASLAATRSDIGRTEDELATATDERLAAQSTLGDQVAALATRQDERDVAQANLDVVTLVLVRAQGELTASQTGLVQDAVRLDAFDRCLVGVAQALNQAAVSDTNGLAATIRDIEGVCAQAGVDL